MKAKNKLREGLEERIKKRIEKFKARKGYRYFMLDIGLPEKEKARMRYATTKAVATIEKILPDIKKLIRSIKTQYIPHIWDQNAITAVYLLVGKSYGNLETIILLAKEGRNTEIIELARSGHESLDLTFLFLEEGQEERLKRWFEGKIIRSKTAREVLHRVLNSSPINKANLPMYDLKTDTYGIYSLYTHSSYAALLDAIDVFHEDFDYERISGYNYILEYFQAIINQLVISLLLELKNIFTKYKNFESVDKVDKLLEGLGNYKVSEAEIKEIFEKYSNQAKK